MKACITILLCLTALWLDAQSPGETPLPPKLDSLKAGIIVHHFPSKVYATTDADQKKYAFFWKHNTSILSEAMDVQVLECGAYLFYNSRWNLRISYTSKDFARLFDCPGGKLKKGQPYTFTDNWRTDNRLSGGWALWYVIGEQPDGKRVFGARALETVGELYSE